MPKDTDTVNEQFNKFLQANFSIAKFDKTQSLTEQQNQIKEAFAKLCDMRGSIKKYMDDYATELKQIFISRQAIQEQNSDKQAETPDTDSTEIVQETPVPEEVADEPQKVKKSAKTLKKKSVRKPEVEPEVEPEVINSNEPEPEIIETPKIKKSIKLVKNSKNIKTDDEEPKKSKKSVKKVVKN